MKRKLFTIAIFALLGSALNAQVIFDPATYPADSLKDGMSIVEMNGKKYLKTPLDGWNTLLHIYDSTVIAAGHTNVKWEVSLVRSVNSEVEYADLRTGIGFKLPDGNGDYKHLSGGNKEVQPSTADFRTLERNAAYVEGDTIIGLQIYSKGGENAGWAIQVGDTMYLGRVEATYPGAIIDPLLFHPDSLHPAYKVETIDGLGYFKVTVDAWNQFYDFSGDILPAMIPENAKAAKAVAKYKIGTGGEPIENLWTVIETNSKFNEAQATVDFSKYHWEVNGGDTLTFIKIVGKRNGNMTGGNWAPVSGDTIWVGMLMAEFADSVKISADAETIDTPGGTLQLTAAVYPDDNLFTDIVWSSNDTLVAKVDETGLVTATGEGFVNITAMVEDGSGMKDVLTIDVSNQVALIEAISVIGEGNATTIETAAGTLQMIATVLPENADETAITWSVSDEGITTISTSGLLTAVANGTVTVTATATDGSEVTGSADITITGQNIGIDGNSIDELVIYPNPASDIVHIENAGSSSKIDILDLNGKLIVQITEVTASMSVDISSLESGLYFVRSHGVEGVRIYKLVK